MPTIDEILAARAASKPKPVQVTVLLDADQSEKIEGLEAELRSLAASTDKRLSKADGSAELEAQLEEIKSAPADALVTFAFEKLPGDMWTDLTSRNPARPDALIDLNYGYNLDAVVQEAAKAARGGHHFAWQVDGDTNIVLTDEQWDAIFESLYGHDMSAVRDAVWNVNEWQPSQRLAAAKKARAGIDTGSN
ncbi:hypothetical protein [Leifsonia poae]|uniref:hypothetical protein n=1 Tax=Leifsonia poae TaxID=110933 RepID=UPI001CBFF418|nr:hypothetical protein [Leifsonia poae]